jgi:CRP-like cAMP-binding protein
MSISSALEPMFTKLSYWMPLDEADRDALLALPHRVRAVEPHHYIVREREKTTHCCLMLSGFSIRHKIVVGGARQIVAIHMTGDMVDLQNSMLGTADHSVQMLTEGEVASGSGSPMSAGAMRRRAWPMCCASSRCGFRWRGWASRTITSCR